MQFHAISPTGPTREGIDGWGEIEKQKKATMGHKYTNFPVSATWRASTSLAAIEKTIITTDCV